MKRSASTLLRNVFLENGKIQDVLIYDGVISGIGATGHPVPDPDFEEIDLKNHLLTASLVEPHCHLDKCFTADLVGDVTGDVKSASTRWHTFRDTAHLDGAAHRAIDALQRLVSHGVTAVRAHVDVGVKTGLSYIEMMKAVRANLHTALDLQVVAFVDNPLAGAAGSANRDILRQSLLNGADVIGGAPYQNRDSDRFHSICLDLAEEIGCGIDFHTDETTDETVLTVLQLAKEIGRRKFVRAVNASHCVSLAVQPQDKLDAAVNAIADVGMAVTCLPQCNLYLQGRGIYGNVPRAIAPIAFLMQKGVLATAGGDNFQDPFNPLGRCDPLETAGLLVTAAHLSPEAAFRAVTDHARQVMGLPEVKVAPGYPADLLTIRARSIREAIADASPVRTVFRAGRKIAQTTSECHYFR